jgi:hypothetical protein
LQLCNAFSHTIAGTLREVEFDTIEKGGEMSRGWKKYQYDYHLFGKRVRLYRSVLRWSFADLSLRTGINKGTLQQVEEKGRSLSENNRLKLVDVLSEALGTATTSIDRREFLKLAGLETGSSCERPD